MSFVKVFCQIMALIYYMVLRRIMYWEFYALWLAILTEINICGYLNINQTLCIKEVYME